MNISGIGAYSDSYNSIRISRLFQSQQAQAAEPQQNSTQAVSQPDERELAAVRDRQTETSADYAGRYEADKTYDLKGADSDLSSLDSERSASGSHRSQIMQQYQMFMGETQAQGINQFAMNTRAVRGIENFAF